MSAVEHEQQTESRSSIALERNARGDCQIKVKLYDGVTETEVDRLRTLAVDNYRQLEREFYGAAA